MSTLAKIAPVHAELKPPPGDDGKPAVAVGSLEDGRVLWKRRLIRSTKAPEIDPATGLQRWELHPTTAQPLYPRFTRERAERDQVFTMESDGHANLYVQEYVPPTEAEVARNKEESAVAAFKDELARAAVKRGLTADELFSRLLDDQDDEGDREEDEPGEFPRHVGGGTYELSNGERMRGKDAAAEAEAALQAQG